jgi:hypothetical protein
MLGQSKHNANVTAERRVPLWVAVSGGCIVFACLFLMPIVPVSWVMGDQWAGENALFIGFAATPITGGIAWAVGKEIYRNG